MPARPCYDGRAGSPGPRFRHPCLCRRASARDPRTSQRREISRQRMLGVCRQASQACKQVAATDARKPVRMFTALHEQARGDATLAPLAPGEASGAQRATCRGKRTGDTASKHDHSWAPVVTDLCPLGWLAAHAHGFPRRHGLIKSTPRGWPWIGPGRVGWACKGSCPGITTLRSQRSRGFWGLSLHLQSDLQLCLRTRSFYSHSGF